MYGGTGSLVYWLTRRFGLSPRVYGGTGTPAALASPAKGLSPRVRGDRELVAGARYRDGSIPACTGEPRHRSRWWPRRRVYPRVYGGTASAIGGDPVARGLSPRVRGNLLPDELEGKDGRSIPACTGEPQASGSMSMDLRSIPACTGEPIRRRTLMVSATVYPRVYGGTAASMEVSIR